MDKINKIRKTFEGYKKEVKRYIESWQKEVRFWKDSYAGLQKALDKRGKRIESLRNKWNTAIEELNKCNANITNLEGALRGLQKEEGCWCEKAIGNPMVTTHSSACSAASKALAPDGGEKDCKRGSNIYKRINDWPTGALKPTCETCNGDKKIPNCLKCGADITFCHCRYCSDYMIDCPDCSEGGGK